MIKINLETKLPEVLKLQNTNRFLIEGWIFGPSRIKNLYVYIGNTRHEAEDIEIFRPDIARNFFHDRNSVFSLFSGFSVPVIMKPVSEYQEQYVLLKAEFKDGQTFTHHISTLKLEPWQSLKKEFVLPPKVNKDELLVICMATYNPKKSRFIRQIDSIIQQDYKNWICIVCDDASDNARKKEMREVLDRDPRFFFIENSYNVGFYYNFERCLELVPSYANYIALSDQDDYWYPNKLSECLARFVGKIQLVYCDMRIVHENGTVISETYWENRKNYYKSKDLDILSIANTVSGAASVFRLGLLKKILPFPPRYGSVFHDQWIAIVAAASGGIDYVNAPLYDYIQSDRNIIGHCDFGRLSMKDFLRIDDIVKFYRLNARNLPFFKKINSLIQYISIIIFDFYRFKHFQGKHIFTLTETASIRNMGFISLIRKPLSFFGLIKMRAKIIWRKETTYNNELSLLFSMIINFIYMLFIPILSRIMLHQVMKRKNHRISSVQHVDPGIIEFKRKFSDRIFEIVEEKPRINFLLSRLDPANFFGGYLAMFNFAKKFSEIGYSVRILLTDQKQIIESDLEKVRSHDLNLRDFLTKVEFMTCYSSEQIIPISREDFFVATSWWTAHIAHQAVQRTKYSKFIYLAQDYEPVFYENGAHRVLAEQSYRFNFFPFFSTDILQRYFIEMGILKKESAGVYFKNPVLNFDLDKNNDLYKNRGKKKLLFYARPQPHNTRNLYPIGCLAIDKAREMGYFQDNEWEVIAIGGDIGVQLLPSGIKINHIGKFDMQKYKSLLPQHDLGLALMDSPHPSLLPIEMASAGLLVITNNYGIKNEEYFSNISKNIKAVAPDPESLALALIEFSKKVNDFNSRIEGSMVKWPHNWEEVLHRDDLENAIESVIKSKWITRDKPVSQSIWDNSKEQYQKDKFKLYWELLPAIENYQMECITGDKKLHYFWYAFNYVKENVGNKNLKGLFLGCIEGNPGPDISLMETGCFDKIDVMDIAEGLLKKQSIIASERKINGIDYIKQDFNKFILQKKEYDVIWAIGTIHHIENLEHFFNQVQNTLKDNGVFILREYIGPNRFQYSNKQLIVINEILSILPEKYKKQFDGNIKNIIERPNVAELIKHDPTESIRPEDIMPLIKERFEMVKLAYTGGTILHPLLSYMASNFENDKDAEAILNLLILFEKKLIENNVLPSDYVFCIAKKRLNKNTNVEND